MYPSIQGWIPLTLSALLLLAGPSAPGVPVDPAPTVALLEDNPGPLLAQLQGQGGGEGIVETRDLYSGKEAVKIIPMQRFGRDVAGWAYRITEHPGPGEYRYVRFAWRADGARGIMLQLHDERDWNIRYTAGVDEPNWGTKFVAPAPPVKWTVVTRDLFADFGDRTIHGIALTVFGGTAGYFDHIHLGRSVEALDAIDATGFSGAPPHLTDDDVGRLWTDVSGGDAPKAYLAFWTLVNAPDRSVPFLRRVLSPSTAESAVQIGRWVADLGADDFATREAATRHLSIRREAAEPLLRRALRDPDSPLEVRIRIEQILKAADAEPGSSDRPAAAVRVLERVGTLEARQLLEEFAKGDPASAVTRAAAAAQMRAAAPAHPPG